MSNPFKPTNSVVNKPKRNSFDLSFSNHLTFNFGQLIPCLCKEVLPGDTFKIDSALGLRFMPLAFPIQTKVRAHVHFFYQRMKNLWKDAPDFIYGNDKLQNRTIVHPYLSFSDGNGANSPILQTCGLGDYLGLPTVRYSSFVNSAGGVFDFVKIANQSLLYYPYKSGTSGNPSIANANIMGSGTYNPLTPNSSVAPDGSVAFPDRVRFGMVRFYMNISEALSSKIGIDYGVRGRFRCTVDLPQGYVLDMNDVYYGVWRNPTDSSSQSAVEIGSASAERISNPDDASSFVTRVTFEMSSPENISNLRFYVCVIGRFSRADQVYGLPTIDASFYSNGVTDAISTPVGSPLTRTSEYHISALPFRCYESIYNAFYRDNRNNPFKARVNGSLVPVYNQYIPTDASGADNYPYGIYNRNWEMDQFTSAVSSPQQGVAPLVGISSLGKVTVQYEGQNYTFDTETADDADTITKVNVTENVPDAVARSLVNVATSGISINDFRNVNAYQRWLETNIRRGLKYKDQTLARWGVSPADSTLDMPEFIGGYSVDVDINTVTNTSAGSDSPLGDYAAQASAFGGSKHRISQYCDQHGFIMAIISVVPVPVYTQLLPKMFLRETALDYYSPEFDQIGMQAVPYRELCPIELFGADGYKIKPTDVFGYQRPWYEYIYSNDEAHGLFRTDFNQFLMSRTFGAPPTLGSDFLTVKESSLNDVFTVKNRNNILGMIRFNIEAQRPIPTVSVPSL